MYKLRTISIKAQVRRLKYFSIFIDFLGTDGLQKQFLENKVLDWSNTSREDFQKLISPTGEISKKNSKIKSQSFQNYLEATRKLNLIEENSIYIQTTRTGQVLYTLKKFPGNSDTPINAYQLNNLEKAFFLYNILLNDADIFITVLRMLYEAPGKPLNNYLKSYQKYFISRLKQKLKVLRPPDSDKVLDALNRVMGWRSPEKYCEDIVSPRLHWMIDLCLLSEKKYELNPQGKAIYEHFPIIEKDIRDIGAEWIENSLADLLSCFFIEHEIKMWSALGSIQKDEVITESLFYAIKYLSVLNIPRLSVPQTFLFTTLFLLYQKNVKIEFSDISNWIGFEKVINDKKIGLRMAARPEESYIRILNA